MNRSGLRRPTALLLALMAVALGTPGPGWAKVHSRQDGAAANEPPSAVTHAGMSLDDAVQMVQHRFKARVVRAETRDENGRTVYHLRLLNSDGKVWTVRVDAQSGAVQ